MQDNHYLSDLRRGISDARLNAYRRPGDVGSLDVIARYLWNIALSEALYPTLQALEVTLRNDLHTVISERFNDALWFDRKPPILDVIEVDKVAVARRELYLEHKPLEAGRLVAALSFGFWTSLFDRRYERIFWPTLLRPTFPSMPRRIRTRQELSRRLNQIRRLRNRVFHHESILNWRNPDLLLQHTQILEIITWMNPAMGETIALIDRFTAIYADGVPYFRTKVEQYFKDHP